MTLLDKSSRYVSSRSRRAHVGPKSGLTRLHLEDAGVHTQVPGVAMSGVAVEDEGVGILDQLNAGAAGHCGTGRSKAGIERQRFDVRNKVEHGGVLEDDLVREGEALRGRRQ